MLWFSYQVLQIFILYMFNVLITYFSDIETIRLGKKHFAHVRFDNYESVDKAIFYSGLYDITSKDLKNAQLRYCWRS